MVSEARDEICFGPFRLDAGNARVLRDGRPVALTPRAFDVLHYLSGRPDRLVTKDELLASVWRDVVVGEASVKVCVREIRQALADDAAAPTYIETVHRRGYRFIAPTTLVRGSAGGGHGTGMTAIAPPAPATAETSAAAPDNPLVGREAELRRLQAGLARAAAGDRQIVFLAGEPGSGKTALAEAFAAAARATPAAVLGGHCFERYGSSEPYMPVWEAIGQFAREQAGTPAAAAVDALLARRAAAYAGAVPAPAGGVPRAADERLLRDMADALEALAAAAGTVVLLLLEDLHWADYSTVDLLSALARRRSPARLMVLATYRPGEAAADGHPLREVVPALRAARLCAELPIDPLDEPAVTRYLAERFGQAAAAAAPPGLARRLHQRTAGHPLFLTHLVDDLADDGILSARGATGDWAAALEDRVPTTVRAMIEAQLDRLERDEQQALEAAAVAGVEFSAAAAAAALSDRADHEGDVVGAERACEDLARRHRFLSAAGAAEWPDGTAATRYRFSHELYHNVVYGRIPVARRVGMHRAVAERLERAWAGRAAEAAAELAMHAEQGRDWPRAALHLHAAADAARRQFAHREAVDYLRRALAAVDRLPPAERGDRELPLLMSLGVNLQVTRGFAAQEVREVHDRAHALCRDPARPPDPKATFRVLWGVWVYHKVRSDLPRAQEMAGQLLDLATEAGDDGMMLQARQAMCVTALCLGDCAASVAHAEAAAAIYDEARHAANTHAFGQDPGVATQAFASVAYQLLGRPADAARASARSLDLVTRLGQPSTRAVALHFAAMYHQCRGSAADAERYAREAIALAADVGFSFWHAGGTVLLGWARVAQGDRSGVADVQRGIAAWLATGSRTYHSYYLGLLADALVRIGRPDEARAVIEQAKAAAAELHEGFYSAELRRLELLAAG